MIYTVRALILILLSLSLTWGFVCHVKPNEGCKPRQVLVKTNPFDEPRFFPSMISLQKCSGTCDTLENPTGGICKSNSSTKIFVKAYDQLHNKVVALERNQDLSCVCACRFSENACHVDQKWNPEKCRCEPPMFPGQLQSTDPCDEDSEIVPDPNPVPNVQDTNGYVSPAIWVLLGTLVAFIVILVVALFILRRRFRTSEASIKTEAEMISNGGPTYY